MGLLHKSIKLEIKLDTNQRTVEGYASVFDNVDSYSDIVVKGAFAESLKARMPKFLWQHNSQDIIGVVTQAAEDERGLYVKGTLAKTAQANDAYELLSMGAVDSFSIGYYATEFEYGKKQERMLKKVDLREVSLVTFPANEAAMVTSVKSMPKTIREFENFLRDEGYSHAEAKAIASRGFKALPDVSRDADAEAKKLISSIEQSINFLRG
jgi:HK97 family phage prohead protease